MRKLQSATRFMNETFYRRVVPMGRMLRDRLVVRPLQVVSPFLKKGAAVRPVLIALIVAGVLLTFVGVRQFRGSSPESASASTTRSSGSAAADAAPVRPHEITCRDLATYGPGQHDYVRLTQFEFGDHYVHRAPVAYLGAVPMQVKDSPAVRPHKVIVKTRQAHTQREMFALEKAPIEGMVVKGIGSLPADEQALLRKSFSHMDLNTCWIIEAGNKPAARGVVASGRNGARAGGQSAGGAAGVADARDGGGRGTGFIVVGTGLAVLAAGALWVAGRRA